MNNYTLQTLFFNSTIVPPMLIVDGEGRMIDANIRACTLFAKNHSELSDSDFSSLGLNLNFSEILFKFSIAKTTKIQCHCLLGTSLPVEISVEKMQHEDQNFFYVILRESSQHHSDCQTLEQNAERKEENTESENSGYTISPHTAGDSIQHTAAQRKKLMELSYRILDSEDAESVFNQIYTDLQELLSFNCCGLYILSNEKDGLIPIELIGEAATQDLSPKKIRFGQGIIGSVAQSKKGELINNAHLDKRSVYENAGRVQTEHMIAIPIGSVESTFGIFVLSRINEGELFTQNEFELTQIFARYASLTIEKAEYLKKLRASEQKYRALTETVGTAIFVCKEMYIEYANPATEYITGYTEKELQRLPFLEIIRQDYRAIASESISSSQKFGFDSKHYELVLISKSGREHWLDFLAIPIEYQGEVTVLCTAVDITDLKNAQIALQQALTEDFRLTVENLQNLVFKLTKGNDGAYRYSLREGRLAGEWTSEKVRGKTPAEIFGQAHGDLVHSYVQRAFDGESINFEIHFGKIWYLYALEPLFSNGNVLEVVGSAVDITSQKEIESKLRESEGRFRTLVESMPLGILESQEMNGEKAAWIFANHEFQQQTGYTIEDFNLMSNEELNQLIHPDDRQMVIEQWEGWRFSEQPHRLHIQYRFKHKNGHYFWIDNYSILLSSAIGENIIIQTAFDISDEKAIEERLRHLASFPELNENPIFEISADGKVIYVNPAAKRRFPTLDVLGFRHTMAQGTSEQIALLRENPGKSLLREIEINGEYFEQRAYFMRDANVYRVYCYDVSARKRAESDLLRSLNKERELNLLKTRFVGTVSHEFRTPLTGILMSAETLERYFDKIDEEKRVEELSKIKIRVKELTSLMDDFLFQSSASTMLELFRPQQIDILDLCTTTIEDFRSKLRINPHEIRLLHSEHLPILIGDPKLIRHILENLFSNAIKYSPTQSRILFEIFHSENVLTLRISDQGIGIPQEEIPRLFTPFFRASNTAKIKGTGLGLSIIKDFVDIHHGNIHIDSELGKGTRITVELPITQNFG